MIYFHFILAKLTRNAIFVLDYIETFRVIVVGVMYLVGATRW